MIPQPDLCVVLDAPADSLWERKHEVSRAEMERLRSTYAVLGSHLAERHGGRRGARAAGGGERRGRTHYRTPPCVPRAIRVGMTETAAIADQIFRQLGDRDGTVGSVAYVTVPGNEHARWLLPEKRPEIGSVLASWAPYRLRSRGAWAMVRAANRMGRVAAIPGTSVLQADKVCDSDWSLLGWRSAESPVPVIYLGTPGPQRQGGGALGGARIGKVQSGGEGSTDQ